MDMRDISHFFTAPDGNYRFARWGRTISPVVFGVADETLGVIKGAIDAVVTLAGHEMADTDPELGANLLMFFITDWGELLEAPQIKDLLPDRDELVGRLHKAKANQYRTFRFDEGGAIKAAFVFIRMDKAMSKLPAEDLALAQAAQVALLWADGTFEQVAPLAKAGDKVILNPEIAGVIRAAYDPVMPAVADDASHALRLAARMGVSA